MKNKFPTLKALSTAAFFLITLLTLMINSCSKANEEALKDQSGISPSNCDTVGMQYTADILPILKANCYKCHSADTYQSSGSQLNYEDFAVLKAEIQNGDLLNAIEHTGSVTPMPLNLPALTSCDINKIKDWINNGIQNN
jgi:hypothetical protein